MNEIFFLYQWSIYSICVKNSSPIQVEKNLFRVDWRRKKNCYSIIIRKYALIVEFNDTMKKIIIVGKSQNYLYCYFIIIRALISLKLKLFCR